MFEGRFNVLAIVSILSLLALPSGALSGTSQQKDPVAQTEKQKEKEVDKQSKPSAAGQSTTLKATLVDKEAKAKKKEATVQVTVSGVKMTDPAIAKEQPKKGQGHLHYKVDNGPVIATTSTKLSFHELTSGEHKITVILAANDHSPLGPEETLTVTIP